MSFPFLTTENLDKTAKKEKGLFIIKFSSKTCGPCKTMAPILEAFHKDHSSISIYEVDVDTSYELAGHFEIRSVPTTLICKGREIIYQFTGVTPKGDIEYVINNIDDPYFKEHGEFEKKEPKDVFLWAGVGGAVIFLLALFVYAAKFM